MHVTLRCAEESHHHALRSLIAGPVTFGANSNQIRIPRRELDLPSRGRDFQLLRLCMMQLERLLLRKSAGHDVPDLAASVRSLLRAQLQHGSSLEQVARALKLGTRTLRRRLEAAGVSFLELLERVRHEAAIEYLTHSADDIAGIAERVGYGDPSNFRRAFRRWTGQSPAAFRAQLQRAGAAARAGAT
jgi:AraC-like DNA-binding protein